MEQPCPALRVSMCAEAPCNSACGVYDRISKTAYKQRRGPWWLYAGKFWQLTDSAAKMAAGKFKLFSSSASEKGAPEVVPFWRVYCGAGQQARHESMQVTELLSERAPLERTDALDPIDLDPEKGPGAMATAPPGDEPRRGASRAW